MSLKEKSRKERKKKNQMNNKQLRGIEELYLAED